MRGLTKKLLTILLSLSLVLAPLQAAFADFSAMSAHDVHLGLMLDDNDAPMETSMNASTEENQYCDHCDVTGDCTGHQCSTSHHASSMLLPVLPCILSSPSMSDLPSFNDGTVRRFPTHLFRPPRA